MFLMVSDSIPQRYLHVILATFYWYFFDKEENVHPNSSRNNSLSGR